MFNEEKGEGEQGQAARSGETPAIGITFQQKYDDYRSVVFQSFVAADCPVRELNTMLDKLRVASERQKAVAHLPTYRGLLNDKRAALDGELEKYRGLEVEKSNMHSRWDQAQAGSGRRVDRPSTLQIQETNRCEQGLATSRSNIEQLRKDIAVHERLVADMEKLIAEGG